MSPFFFTRTIRADRVLFYDYMTSPSSILQTVSEWLRIRVNRRGMVAARQTGLHLSVIIRCFARGVWPNIQVDEKQSL